MPQTIRRFGDKLLAQQLWCWGRDIEGATENLLVRFGFQRHRDRETDDRSTCYRLDQGELHVSLWGFGIFFGRRDMGGLFLNRFGFCPDWAPIESLCLDIHWPDELPIFARPYGLSQWQRAQELWQSLLFWIADYEKWVVEFAGPTHRQASVNSWLRPFVRADRMAAAWRYLGRRGWEKRNGITQKQPMHQQLKRFTF